MTGRDSRLPLIAGVANGATRLTQADRACPRRIKVRSIRSSRDFQGSVYMLAAASGVNVISSDFATSCRGHEAAAGPRHERYQSVLEFLPHLLHNPAAGEPAS